MRRANPAAFSMQTIAARRPAARHHIAISRWAVTAFAVAAFVLLPVATIALIAMNPLLALLATPALPFLAWRAFRFGLLVRPLSMEAQDRLAGLTGVLEQNLRAARVVRAYSQEEREMAKFSAENERWFVLTNKLGRIQAVQGPMLTLIADAAMAIVLGFGGYLVTRGRLSLGELVAFTTYMAQLAQPVRMMGVIAPVVGMAAASGERIVELLDAEGGILEVLDVGNGQVYGNGLAWREPIRRSGS